MCSTNKNSPSGEFFALCLEELGDRGLAASGGVLLHQTALVRLVYRLVGVSERLLVALRGEARHLHRDPESLTAHVINSLLAEALAVRFLGRLGNCHARIVLYIGMIGKLTGVFGGKTENGVLIEVGGVGYAVRVPLHSLLAEPGAPISLLIHTAVREDAIDLYGFPTEGDLAFFKQLMSVSGIGPKTALSIMSVADAAVLRRTIAAGDAATLTKVFGIGKKSAERIVVELRDKVAGGPAAAEAVAGASGDDTEVIEALMALGYRADESRQALRALGPETTSIQAKLGAALKQLGSSGRTTV